MDRRILLKTVGMGLGLSALPWELAKADNTSPAKATFVLVHGSWHGAWCFDKLMPYLATAGNVVVAKDLPGHGLRARYPMSYLKRPFDPAAFASEPSAVGNVTLDDYTNSIVETIDELTGKGSGPVILVGHSMGGLPISLAAEKVPGKIRKLVYLSAHMVPNGTSGAEFRSVPENSDSKIGGLFKTSPAKVGAMRIDPRSDDASYLALLKAALYADVSDELVAAAANFVCPDDPAAPFQTPVVKSVQNWGSVKRAYISCSQDFAIRPALQRKYIAMADAFTPGNKTEVRTMESSHSPFLSDPARLAQILMELVA